MELLGSTPKREQASRVTRSIVVALLAVGLGAGVGLFWIDGRDSPPAPAPVAHSVALDALHDWDQRRARAWSDGNVAALRALYTPNSAAGRKDVDLLRRYRDRGLTVDGLSMQVLRVQTVHRSSRRLELVVTDRLASAVARSGSGQSARLPEDSASTRRIVLVRGPGAEVWQVSRVLSSGR